MNRAVRMKKIIRWSLLVVIFLVGAGAGVLLWQVNRVKQALADFIVAHPEETAVVTYTFDEDGILVEDESAIFHNADKPLVVASVMKTAILAAYAQGVVTGSIDPAEPVSVAEWESYYLPLSDGGAHKLGLQSLGLAVDELGFAVDQTAVVTLDDLATIMMHYSGNASTDYLLERVGQERVTAVLQEHLPNQAPIFLTLGYGLAAFNHEEPFSANWLQQVQTDLARNDTSKLDHLIDLYRHDAAWREAQIKFMQSLGSTEVIDAADMWQYQTAVGQLLPTGTAREYAQMFAQIASKQFISAAVSTLMQQKLESVPSDWPLRTLFFQQFAAKDGITAGVLAVASYATPRRGALQNQNRVVVLLVNGLAAEEFIRQAQFQGHYLLPIDLAIKGGLFEQIKQNG